MSEEQKYDSSKDTYEHIGVVRGFLVHIGENIFTRAAIHDASKLREPEKSMYDKFTPLLRGLTYGSDEYKKCLEAMGTALKNHYALNKHHPEHYPEPVSMEIGELSLLIRDKELGAPDDPALPWLYVHLKELESRVNGMSLLDVIEMVADWKAAGQRHADGDMTKSLEINRDRFGLSPQLFSIIKNTVKELGW